MSPSEKKTGREIKRHPILKLPPRSTGSDLRSASSSKNRLRSGVPFACSKQSQASQAGNRDRHEKWPNPTIAPPRPACSLKKNGIPIGGFRRVPPPGCQKLTSSHGPRDRRNEYQSKSVRPTYPFMVATSSAPSLPCAGHVPARPERTCSDAGPDEVTTRTRPVQIARR